MKLLSIIFRPPPLPATTPVAAEPAPPPPGPAPPAVDPAEQQRLLEAIESGAVYEAELMRLAVEGQTTRLRQAAAAAIHDPASWQVLLPRLRGRDKAAHRSIKQRLDALQAEQRQQVQSLTDAEALCAAIERFVSKTHDPQFAVMLSAYAARWQALPAGFDDALIQRGQVALARGQQFLAGQEQERARVAAERDAEAAQASALAAARQAEREAAAEEGASAAREQAALDEAREAEAQAEARAQDEQQAVDAQAHGEILSLIRLAGAALGRGDTRKAARFRQSIETALQTTPPLPPHLARNLEQLDERLNQLRQWKDYAAAPKRIELIEEVEALIGVTDEPEALTEHLRALRQEWRTINKGLEVEATAESERFEKAYAAAFQPCQVYLNEQAAIRRANLEARKRVLERVLAFEAGLDAEQPDHLLMMRVLREAPQQWRGHQPVDRDASRPVDAELFGALDRLRARVSAWHAGNAAEKQALIDRAAQLATLPDLARAIDEVKRLQAQWKTTGPIPHVQSQALWEAFRAQCNAVFDRRQQEVAQQNAALAQAKSAAEDLLRQIDEASQQGPPDRPTGEARLREWQTAFHAIGELPRSDARGLNERYQRAMTKYDALIAGLAQRDADAVEANVLTAAKHVRAFQRAVIEGTTGRDELRAAAEAFIAGVPRWPAKSISQALRQSLARADAPDFGAASEADRALALRRLCIHAEILSDSLTPPNDTALRREQELQLLRQGLGQARQADARAWEAMRIEWLGLDAAEPTVHDELEQRFLRCFRRSKR